MTKILFVTDNTRALAIYQEALSKNNYIFDAALSAEEAFSRISAGKPDAVVLAHTAISKDVFESQLKRSETQGVSVIVLSASDMSNPDPSSLISKLVLTLKKKKILIAEDDRQMAQIFKSLLEVSGFEARTAYDGAEALSLIKSWKPELVVLDIMLPVIDGFHVCQMVNEDHSIETRPRIIIISGRSSDWDQSLGAACGAEDYLVKPINNMEFIAKVRAILTGNK